MGNGVKLGGMCLFMAVGYWIDRQLGGDGFRGAIVGVAVSSIGKYLLMATIVHRRGLRPFNWDLFLTGMVTLGAVIAVAVDHWMVLLHATNLLIVLACGMAACLLWLPLLFTAWRIVKPARAAA
jgi:hypothetical protein